MTPTYAELTTYLGAFSVLCNLSAAIVVPPAWQGLLGASAPDKIRLVIARWEQYYQHEFSALLGVLAQRHDVGYAPIAVLARPVRGAVSPVFKPPRLRWYAPKSEVVALQGC